MIFVFDMYTYWSKIAKQIIPAALVLFTTGFASCSSKSGGVAPLSKEDSIKVRSDETLRARLAILQSQKENLSGPSKDGDPTVSDGDLVEARLVSDSANSIIKGFEKIKTKLERAQKDSTTSYGALLTRFRLLSSKHKYITATYTDNAHLLRFTSEVTTDDKHKDYYDFYFSNGELVYFRERHNSTRDDQDIQTDDTYYIQKGVVVYSYRDDGSAPSRKDHMGVISSRRYALKGDVTAHVAKEFANFRGEHDLLAAQPLEPLIYPGDARPQP